MQCFIPTTIRNFNYQVTILANSNYLPFTQTDIQKKYLRENLIKINLGALVEDHLTQIY